CCLLPAACCLLPAACCLLPAACCLLPAACCLLPAACCLLLTCRTAGLSASRTMWQRINHKSRLVVNKIFEFAANQQKTFVAKKGSQRITEKAQSTTEFFC
ncbi:MAG: hypothetical protein LBK76_08760, partial [Verrucomicrobiales bacterium]|nr:hypothetical protein [Verrucomicrobiales bacterium]